MIEIMEEQRKHHDIVSHFLLEQRRGREPPLFGGNQGANGSHRGNENYEQYPRKYQAKERRSTEGMPTHSHMASRTIPTRPYMPTFLEAQRRDTNALGLKHLESEWEVMEREYNALSVGFQI
jgi:hypothetical protein